MKQYDLHLIALTQGKQGAILISNDQSQRTPRSSGGGWILVGAGDAFTAAMTIGLLASHHLEIINYYACRVAAFVCSQTGTVPDIPDELHISNIIKLK